MAEVGIFARVAPTRSVVSRHLAGPRVRSGPVSPKGRGNSGPCTQTPLGVPRARREAPDEPTDRDGCCDKSLALIAAPLAWELVGDLHCPMSLNVANGACASCRLCLDSPAHLLSSCQRFGRMYTFRHNNIQDHLCLSPIMERDPTMVILDVVMPHGIQPL